MPDYTGKTFKDAINYGLRLQSIIKKQNRDKEALREWRNGVSNAE